MDLAALSLPDWMPWWAVIGVLVPVAFYLALFLLMPFSTFGLRAKLRDMEGQIEALHEEIRALTLRLPERGGPPGLGARGLDPDEYATPPIPPVAREPRPAPRAGGGGGGLGDPMADRMLAYMREKAQSDMDRAGNPEPRPVRQRAEPRFVPPVPAREAELPPPPPLGGVPEAPEPDMPPPPRLPPRFVRRRAEDDGDDAPPPPPGPRIDWPR